MINLRVSVCAVLVFVLGPGAKATNYVGNPNEGNGWDSTGAVTTRASSEHPLRTAVQTINGSGMDTVGSLHDNDPSNMWVGVAPLDLHRRFPAEPAGHWIEFAFDQSYVLDQMIIWNYAEIANVNDPTWQLQGVQHATILVSESGNGSGWGSDNIGDWTQVHAGDLNWYAPPTGGLQVPAINIMSIGTSARYVLLYTPPDDRTNYANENGFTLPATGLSEVRFSIVPEPATMVLSGLGISVLLLRRRH